MIVSRGLLLGRAMRQCINLKTSTAVVQSNRLGHAWSYRTNAAAPPKKIRYAAEAVAGLMWWWILWHLYHDFDHITGEFYYPDPSEWTNAELGIPPDNYE